MHRRGHARVDGGGPVSPTDGICDAAPLGPGLVGGGHGFDAVGVLAGQVVRLGAVGLEVVDLPELAAEGHQPSPGDCALENGLLSV